MSTIYVTVHTFVSNVHYRSCFLCDFLSSTLSNVLKIIPNSWHCHFKPWRNLEGSILTFCCLEKKIVSLISNYDDCIYSIPNLYYSLYIVYHIYILFLAGLFANKWTMKMKILQYLFSRDGTKIYFGKHFGKIYIFKIKKFRLYFFVRKE